METSQTATTRAVLNYLKETGTTKTALASELGLTAGGLRGKLAGRRRWSIDELDSLAYLGVAIPVPAQGWDF